ncbi:MAG: isoleucine--tRNA ligase [Mycoplasmataceae bacterium]|nr:isoleucine--tRNA ligase [Mycoplasmataceae bacterium]
MSKDYKDTLIMPFTKFEMRGNLVNKEPLFRDKWLKENIFSEWNNNKKKTFNLHDGPPYANGNIHVGHALNKILKDIIIKYKAMSGHQVYWTMGWDTHGLPIEVAVQKKGYSVKKMEVGEYLSKAKEYALKQVENQKEQMKNLSLSSNFNDIYKTLDNEFEAQQLDIFSSMFRDGLIYQDLKPIHWSWSSETALAEAEIEYKDVVSPSIFVPFEVKKDYGLIKKQYKLVIWTTTPWTLPANVGIALGKKINYSLVETQSDKFIIATELVEKFLSSNNLESISVNHLATGSEIAELNITAINPLNNNDSKVIVANHVTTEAGTGSVHIAGGHGADDFIAAKEHNLKIFTVLDERGIMINSGDDWNGKFYLKAQNEIVDYLKSINKLISKNDIKHSYPHDWRTKKPVVFRATKQWFASINKIRDDLIKSSDLIDWVPAWGKQKLSKMILNRDDWCISRQRFWGFPLPIIYKPNGQPIKDKEFFDHIKKLFTEHGSSIWFSYSIQQLLPKSIKFEEGMRKEKDTMDVWFDSGSSWSLVKNYKNQPDIDLYLEGSDQYRGWFSSSLITSYATTKKPMTKQILSHGFVLDEKGNKMSKSLGNTIDPLKVTKTLGSDILRLWVASVDYKNDVRIGDNILKQSAESYRKLRNTIKFMLGNLNDFDYEKNQVKELNGVHNYINYRLSKLVKNVIASYDKYDFSKVVSDISLFFINDLSSFYFDYAKDILYTKSANDLDRRSIQTVIYRILDTLVPYLAPIIPVTIDETYSYLPKKDRKKSIFLEEFKTVESNFNDEQKWEDFFKLRDLVNKEIEVAIKNGVLKRSLEANVEITLPNEFKQLNKFNLVELLVVGKVSFLAGNELSVTVSNLNGEKCPRCWKFFEKEEINSEGICSSCNQVVTK